MAEASVEQRLAGNYAPVTTESTVFSLSVDGRLPAALNGRFVQVGPNPLDPTDVRDPWLAGDGMVHGVELYGGSVRWYRNRWVLSPAVAGARGTEPVPDAAGGLPGPGNGRLFEHAGRLYVTGSPSLPYELSPALETLRQEDFEAPIVAGGIASVRRGPGAQTLHALVHQLEPPYLRALQVGDDGRVGALRDVSVPVPALAADFALTESRLVIPDLPVVFSMEDALEGTRFPWRWDERHEPRVGLLPLDGDRDGDADWLELPPCFFFDAVNAFDDGETVVMDLIRRPVAFAGASGSNGEDPTLCRWTLDPRQRSVTEEHLDAAPQDLPAFDPRRRGRRHRFVWAIAGPDGAAERESVLKHDLARGTTIRHPLGAGRQADRLAFVPAAAAAAEDEGWLLGFVYDAARQASDFVVLDARDFEAAPLAIVELPVRVPFGRDVLWLAG